MDQLEHLMQELADGISGARVEVGRTDRPRHNDIFLKLTSPLHRDRFAIISTGGSGTFELAVDGGFSTLLADDQADADDARDYLESYIRAAVAYLDGHWSIRRSKLLRVPILTIEKGVSRLNLASPGHGSSNNAKLSF